MARGWQSLLGDVFGIGQWVMPLVLYIILSSSLLLFSLPLMSYETIFISTHESYFFFPFFSPSHWGRGVVGGYVSGCMVLSCLLVLNNGISLHNEAVLQLLSLLHKFLLHTKFLKNSLILTRVNLSTMLSSLKSYVGFISVNKVNYLTKMCRTLPFLIL